ncbi:MAG: sugar ABC transporter ATP-binding protein [Euzebyaceae bacterium]|nr:sugar ABC transporter ATP-binding protein [Euzebyaceae bacterium]
MQAADPRGDRPPTLQLRGVEKSYEAVRALASVDLDLHGGEVHALLGQNGAGKSTLVKIVTGAAAPGTGRIVLDGRPVAFASPADARAAGIAVVHQDSHVFADLSVADNVLVAQAPAIGWGPFRRRDRRGAVARTAELLAGLGVRLDPRVPLRTVSPAERKFIEVARAIAGDARVLVLDEPTAALEPGEAERLFGVLDRLCGAGVAVLFVSHRLAEVKRLSSRVTVLRDGAVIAREHTRDVTLHDLSDLIAGRRLDASGAPGRAVGERRLAAAGVDGAGFSGPVDLDVGGGEIVALTGLAGSGATAFARCVSGAAGRRAGRVTVDGVALRPGSRPSAVGAGVGFVPEDRKHEAIVPELSIERNIALGALRDVTRRGTVSRRAMRRLAERYIELLAIRPPVPTMPAGKLSGGNQQKVLLARWLASGSTVLVMEEPTHGLDVGAKADIHEQLRDFAAAGGGILMVSSEHADILGLADRVGVFHDGRLVRVVPAGATESDLLRLSAGILGDRREAG